VNSRLGRPSDLEGKRTGVRERAATGDEISTASGISPGNPLGMGQHGLTEPDEPSAGEAEAHGTAEGQELPSSVPPFSVWDLQSAPQEKRLRRLPGVVWRCLRLVWAASPRSCVWAALLQVTTGIGVAVELLAARELLSELLVADQVGGLGLSTVAGPLVILLITATIVGFASAVQGEQQRVMGELVSRHVSGRLLDVTAKVDLQSYETPAFFDRLQRAEIAGHTRPWQMTMGLLVLMSSGITVVGISAAILAIEPLLLPLVLASSLPFWMATVRNSRAAHAFAYEMTPADREREYLRNVLTGSEFAAEVRMFGVASLFRKMYDTLYTYRITRFRHLVRQRTRRSLAATAATAVFSASALLVLISLVLSERIEMAGAITAALSVQQLGVRLRNMYASAGSLYEGALFLEDFESFLRLGDGQDRTRTGSVPAPAHFSKLLVEDVTFEYPGTGTVALSNVSMEIQAGEVVALVGENGSGKTTLAKLLCQLYRPTSGRILWDGVDTAACHPDELRYLVSGIFQDFAHYHLRARDNIAIGRHEWFSDLERIVSAARHSGAHEFLARLPEGYETRLGRRFADGRELSIGQWQRVALARAFFRSAPLIVLDEPTAALDPRAERELFDAVRQLTSGRTLLLISHRFSSVRSADRILVLQGGHIVEQGTHKELLAAEGLYAKLFTMQASSYLDESPP
jgi:ATP-binding cassette subfamily B protein